MEKRSRNTLIIIIIIIDDESTAVRFISIDFGNAI